MSSKLRSYAAARWAERATTRPGVVLVVGAVLALLADDPALKSSVIATAIGIAGGLAASSPDRSGGAQ